MSNVDKLVSLGAECVGGDLIYKHKVMGSFRNGDFTLSADGKALLDMDITDVEVKEVKPKKAKAKPEPVVEPEATVDALMDFDSLMD